MLGLGEEWDEIVATLRDLRTAGCAILTLGQYLRPSAAHLPMTRYYHPDEFRELKAIALEMGFAHVESGPLVRSSYHAHEQADALLAGRLTRLVAAVAAVSLTKVHNDIVTCSSVSGCGPTAREIARVKRAAFRNDTYWAKPVPGFGDPNARVLILGLAPAAHGANRTGRVFTGDGGGGSGDFLMTAMHRHGFASIPTSQSHR